MKLLVCNRLDFKTKQNKTRNKSFTIDVLKNTGLEIEIICIFHQKAAIVKQLLQIQKPKMSLCACP